MDESNTPVARRLLFNAVIDTLEKMHYDLSQLIITVDKYDGDSEPFRAERKVIMEDIKIKKSEYYAG